MKTLHFHPTVMCGLVSLSFAITGCGRTTDADPELVPVTGVVMVDGKLLPEGTVMFAPADEEGSASSGMIKEGLFELVHTASAKGARPGRYKVTVSAWRVKPTMGADGIPTAGEPAVPKKYFSLATSPLTATVEPGGSQNINIELSSKE